MMKKKGVSRKININLLKGLLILLIIILIIILYQFNSYQKSLLPNLSPSGNTSYVDATNGLDTNAGTSELLAFKTISKVNSLTLVPGDYVLFKRGELWREQLDVSSSGNSSANILFGAYGSGAKPIISGANNISGWEQNDTNLWNASLSIPTKQVFFNGVRGIPVPLDQIDSSNEWNWSNNILSVYSTSDPDTSFISPGIEASVRSLGVFISGKDYITIDGLHATKTNNVGIQAYAPTGDTDYIRIINSESSYNYGHGVLTTNSDSNARNDFGYIENVTSYGNGGSGIQISSRTNNTVVRYSTAYGNGFAITEGTGIGSYNASNLLVEHSVSHSNFGTMSGSGAGFYFDVFGENDTFRYNIAYNNSKNGFIAEQGVGVKMYYNIAYNNSEGGFTLYGSDGRSGIHNNSIYNNIAIGNKYGIWIHGDYAHVPNSVVGNEIKNNIAVNNSVYQLFAENGGDNDGTNGTNNVYENNAFGKYYNVFIKWGILNINDYLELNTAYDAPTYSITNYPLFVNYGAKDFRLLQNSPGIDSGVVLNFSRDFSGNYVPQGNAPDIGAYEFLNITYTNFDGATTNLSSLDSSSVNNLILEKTGKGKIQFSSPLNLSNGFDFNSRVIISDNNIEINSSLSPELNKSATLTLYDLGYSDPDILRDGADCPSSVCTKISYSSGDLVFSVTGFSKYSARESSGTSGTTTSPGSGGTGTTGGNTTNNASSGYTPGGNTNVANASQNATIAGEGEVKDKNTLFIYIVLIIILLLGIFGIGYLIWYVSTNKDS